MSQALNGILRGCRALHDKIASMSDDDIRNAAIEFAKRNKNCSGATDTVKYRI